MILSRQAVRLSLALALTLPMFIWGSGNASDAGREFSRCSRACNDIRRACQDRGAAICFVPGLDEAAQQTCFLECDAVCAANTMDCKDLCQEFFKAGPPSEP